MLIRGDPECCSNNDQIRCSVLFQTPAVYCLIVHSNKNQSLLTSVCLYSGIHVEQGFYAITATNVSAMGETAPPVGVVSF